MLFLCFFKECRSFNEIIVIFLFFVFVKLYVDIINKLVILSFFFMFSFGGYLIYNEIFN